MAYIGRQLVRGQNRIYDDISSSFNGSTTAFNLTIGGDATPPAQVNQLWIVLGGILQKPGTDFTVADAQVTFTTAPAAGLDFWAMIQGDTSDMNAPSDGSVTPTKIATSGDFSFPADIRLTDADGSHYVGIQAPTTVSSNLVWTLPAADGSANQLLKTNGSGVLGWATDSATDSTKMPLAGGTFTGDITFDGATAGRDIIWDRSDNALEFADNAQLVLGTGGDLEIYHSGTHSFIKDGGTGNLQMWTNQLSLLNAAGDESMIQAIENGAVELYHNNSKKLETTTDGVTVTGDINVGDGEYYASDNGKLRLGSSQDLELYHDGTDSHIVNATGILNINNDDIRFKTSGAETMLRAIANGSVKLMYNNTTHFETSSSGCKITGGAGHGLQIENSGGTNAACVDLKNTLSSYVKEYRIAVAGSDGAYATASSLFVRDQTSGANRLEIQSGGDVRIGTGDIYFGTAGKGIVLGNTSNVDANTLDDYEEGTWTPAFNNVTVSSYNSQGGRYTKVGRYVYVTGVLNVASGLDNTDASSINIGGLPFTGNSDHEACLFTFGRYTSLLTQAALDDYTGCRFGGDFVLLLNGNNGGVDYNQCNTSGVLQFSFCYQL